MTNGDDTLELMDNNLNDALERVDQWNARSRENGKSDHDHAPLRDLMKMLKDNVMLMMRRILGLSKDMELLATKDDIDGLAQMIRNTSAAEDYSKQPAATVLKQRTSLTLFKGLLKFDGIEIRDIGRLMVGGAVLWIMFKVVNGDLSIIVNQ